MIHQYSDTENNDFNLLINGVADATYSNYNLGEYEAVTLNLGCLPDGTTIQVTGTDSASDGINAPSSSLKIFGANFTFPGL